MLTTVRPIFQHVPASYADPVGLADQQAQGVVSLIVVRYEPGEGHEHDALGPFYDSYIAVSGQLLAVARTTEDYRYPVTPAVGLSRFIEHRDAGHPAFLSVYEVSEEDCARFVETVFYSECLKLHVDGADSAALVAQQIVRSGCGDGVPSGILEVNDFSQPGEPRIRLVDLDVLAASIGTVPVGMDPTIQPGTVDPIGLTAVLAGHLDSVNGRVLLYDRLKNKAAMPHRAGKPFDLDAAIQQANRLAEARRSTDPAQAARQVTIMASQLRAEAPPDQVEAVEEYLRDAAEPPRAVAPTHPHHVGLAALVAEMQGGPAAPSFAGLGGSVVGDEVPVSAEPDSHHVAPEPSIPGPGEAGPPLLPSEAAPILEAASGDTSLPTPEASTAAAGLAEASPSGAPAPPEAPSSTVRTPATAPSLPPSSGERHVLATELDVLRAGVYALFEDAIGREKSVAHEQHILEEHGIASPVSAEDTVRYLRVLLCDNPPSRWHGFKRARGKIYGEVCTKLLAFHTANAHVDDVVIHEVGQLWARLCA